MNPYIKAYMNHKHDTQMRHRDGSLSRKPGSTPQQRAELTRKIMERKANGTLGKVPFVLEAVSNPYTTLNGKWALSLTYSDGITRRVPEVRFTSKTEAQGFYDEALNHIGQTQEQSMLGGAR